MVVKYAQQEQYSVCWLSQAAQKFIFTLEKITMGLWACDLPCAAPPADQPTSEAYGLAD